uniref:ATP-citrate synthase citrate-binding domain-containing protein n=1 Tax=Aegilops tauschii subsp. strangulata TaxID=200361 RepID=A0A453JXR5_AEGTS
FYFPTTQLSTLKPSPILLLCFQIWCQESKLKAARVNIYVRRGGPNYQTGLAKMRALGSELGLPIEVYGPEATMTGICKQAIDCVMAEA